MTKNYKELIKNLDKQKAQNIINKLQIRIDSGIARAQRAAMRAEDAGPMDIASERLEPLQIKKELLQFFVSGKNPSKELLKRWDDVKTSELEHKQYKDKQKEKLSKLSNDVGKTIWFNDKHGRLISKVIMKQKLGYNDKPIYKTVPDEGGSWTVPASLVKRMSKNVDMKSIESKKKEEKEKKNLGKTLVGKKITWNSKKARGEMNGKVLSSGSKKVKVETDRGIWNVPISFITKINGEPLNKVSDMISFK